MPLTIPIWLKTIIPGVVSKLVALQTFFLGRPRIDVDVFNDPNNLYGQNSFGYSNIQRLKEPILQIDADSDMEFFWNFIVRLKNNSPKTGYEVKITKINLTFNDDIDRVDNLQTLKEGESVEFKYRTSYRAHVNRFETHKYQKPFPGHLESIIVVVEYKNEGRTTYYSKYVKTQVSFSNEHYFFKPKELK